MFMILCISVTLMLIYYYRNVVHLRVVTLPLPFMNWGDVKWKNVQVPWDSVISNFTVPYFLNHKLGGRILGEYFYNIH